MRKYMLTIIIGIVFGVLGSAQAASVFFTKMTVNDCKEFGTCDWWLSCALNNENEKTFFQMVEADTGDEIEVNRDLVFQDFPVTVHCTVKEHDGGIGAGWEDVGSGSITVATAGEYKIHLDNNEGDVDVEFTVDNVGQSSQGLTVASPRRYVGVFRSGSDGHFLWVGVEWDDFVAKWTELSNKGFRLIDLETYKEGNKRLYAGVFRAGSDKHFLWAGVEWDAFVAKWKELSNKGLRLIDLETYEESNKRLYAGVFRAGSDGHFLWAGPGPDFLAKWKELSLKGFRLIDLEIYPE
jgi:hypothetical protein